MLQALLILLLGADACLSNSLHEFYYFNPDSPFGNLGRLKGEMDSFFAKTNLSISFQPFSHLSDLEREIRKNRPAFVLVPQWYWQRYGQELNLRPLLMPLSQNGSTYRKVLLASRQSDINVQNLGNHSLAMTTMGPEGHQELRRILGDKLEVDTDQLNIVIVPKDTDALFAVALGHVELALVALNNLELIARLNPNLVNNVRDLVETHDIPMPILCYVEGLVSEDTIKSFENTLLDPGMETLRREFMEKLQFHAWKKWNE